jgi:hypothetical protein
VDRREFKEKSPEEFKKNAAIYRKRIEDEMILFGEWLEKQNRGKR